MTLELIRASALRVTCPRCGALPDESCRSVMPTQRGGLKKHPHNARVRAAQ